MWIRFVDKILYVDNVDNVMSYTVVIQYYLHDVNINIHMFIHNRIIF